MKVVAELTVQELCDTLQVYAHNGFAQHPIEFVRYSDEGTQRKQEIVSIKVDDGCVMVQFEPKK